MSDLPNGVDYHSIRASIAWEMVKIAIANNPKFGDAQTDERLNTMLDAYAKASAGVFSPKSITTES